MVEGQSMRHESAGQLGFTLEEERMKPYRVMAVKLIDKVLRMNTQMMKMVQLAQMAKKVYLQPRGKVILSKQLVSIIVRESLETSSSNQSRIKEKI